jgi:hypothetical protein
MEEKIIGSCEHGDEPSGFWRYGVSWRRKLHGDVKLGARVDDRWRTKFQLKAGSVAVTWEIWA